MRVLSCDEVRLTLSDMLAGNVVETDGVDAHLAGCIDCRRQAGVLFVQDRLLAQLAAMENIESMRARIRAALAPAPTSAVRPRAWWPIAAAVAACLLVAVGFVGWNRLAPSPLQARLDRIEGEVFVLEQQAKHLAKVGEMLRPGQGLQVGEESFVRVAFADTTQLEVGAATTVRWPALDGRKLILEEGTLTAEVPDEASETPMVLATPQVEFVAQNNRVYLVNHANETRVEPQRNAVKIVHKSDQQSLAVRPGWFALASAKGFVSQRLSPRLTSPRTTFSGSTTPLTSLAYSGDLLAAGSSAGEVRVWDTRSNELHRDWHITEAVRVLAFSPDQQTLAAASDGRMLWFGNLVTGQVVSSAKGPPSSIFAMRFLSDSSALLTCGYDRRLKEWDPATARLKKFTRFDKYRSDFDFPASMAFSPDGSRLAWGLKDNTTRLWDVSAAAEHHVLAGHDGAVTAVAFSPDGQWLATGSRDRNVKLWDVATGTLRATLAGHRHSVVAVAFHPDGKLLATGSADTTVKFWDLATFSDVASLQGHVNAVQAVLFAPDGKTLATAGADGFVHLWDVPGGQSR